jgi:hypothetical protein
VRTWFPSIARPEEPLVPTQRMAETPQQLGVALAEEARTRLGRAPAQLETDEICKYFQERLELLTLEGKAAKRQPKEPEENVEENRRTRWGRRAGEPDQAGGRGAPEPEADDGKGEYRTPCRGCGVAHPGHGGSACPRSKGKKVEAKKTVEEHPGEPLGYQEGRTLVQRGTRCYFVWHPEEAAAIWVGTWSWLVSTFTYAVQGEGHRTLDAAVAAWNRARSGLVRIRRTA